MMFLRRGLGGISAALFVTCLAAPALGQLSPTDIQALAERGAAEGWTFTVAPSEATEIPLEVLCGAKPPADWEALAPADLLVAPAPVPTALDWRMLGGGLPMVRNQGQCGSCWAFATTGPLECALWLFDGLDVELSNQYLVTCNHDGWGCGGGWWAHAYHLDATDSCGAAGAVLADAYPYLAHDGPCQCPFTHVYKLTRWARIGTNPIPSLLEMKQALLEHGPITVGITVNNAFQAYSTGIFNACDNVSPINHGVTLVGWNDAGGYWIIRNSWGSGWGEGGYMRIAYGCASLGYAACYADYRPYAVSGYVVTRDGNPVPGVTLTGLPHPMKSAENGYFMMRTAASWVGTITPSSTYYSFTPPQLSVAGPAADLLNQNFTAIPYHDCNNNGYADEDDLRSGFSRDTNNDGIPDECEVLRGDVNCDGAVDFRDINAFVLAISYPTLYTTAFPRCFLNNADANGDGVVDFRDINAFVRLVSGD